MGEFRGKATLNGGEWSNSNYMGSELAKVQDMEEKAKEMEYDYNILQEEFEELLNDGKEELERGGGGVFQCVS